MPGQRRVITRKEAVNIILSNRNSHESMDIDIVAYLEAVIMYTLFSNTDQNRSILLNKLKKALSLYQSIL